MSNTKDKNKEYNYLYNYRSVDNTDKKQASDQDQETKAKKCCSKKTLIISLTVSILVAILVIVIVVLLTLYLLKRNNQVPNQHENNCIKNPKFVKTLGLQYYWPFCSSFTDIISQVTLSNGTNAGFIRDRFRNNNSALNLENGYLQAPSGVYFNGGSYTFMAWVYPRSFNFYTKDPPPNELQILSSHILNFGNGQEIDNVVFSFSFSHPNEGRAFQAIYKGKSQVLWLMSSYYNKLKIGEWTHLAFVFSSSTLKSYIYINGKLEISETANDSPNNVLRTSNYIGKSNSIKEKQATDAVIDELKIFSLDLAQSQIQKEMENEYYLSKN